MTAFTQAQLDEALNAHERFVNRAGGGMRLILRYTVLDGLDLAGRDLREVDLSACSLVGCDLRVARLETLEIGKTGEALGALRQARVDDTAAALERRAVTMDGIDLS
ncbi:MAG TPA: pentapeptide repeat-containing protein, partial [Phenylobacterium sp.]|nr:pentapeptide repeat-containing protein [Phenylobacterium sp.]